MSVHSSDASAEPQERSFWIAVICGALILTIGIGARQSFGIFQKPIAADLSVGRELWSAPVDVSAQMIGQANSGQANSSQALGTITPSNEVERLTGKERLSEKWKDDQRVDNCRVPIDKRGSKVRPDSCDRLPKN